MNRYLVVAVVAMAVIVIAGPAQAEPTGVDSFFDVFAGMTAGPPYPTPPVEVLVGHEKEEPGTIQPDAIMGLSLQDTTDSMPLSIYAYDTGDSEGRAGVESVFELSTELPNLDDFPAESFFDVFCEFNPPEPGMDTPVLTGLSNVSHDESSFDVFFDLEVEGGRESLHLQGVIQPDQPMLLSDVFCSVDDDCDSFFDIFIEVSSNVPPAPWTPLMYLTMTGTFTPVPEPASVLLCLLGAASMLAMSRRARVK